MIFQSHPSWVCGLKREIQRKQAYSTGSHPSWVCGLKHGAKERQDGVFQSHTLRGCVD